MSSVRMCDRCGTVFSELAEGWQTFTATTMKKDDEGRRLPVQAVMDACPTCAITPEPPEVQTADTGYFARKQLEQRNAELEEELRHARGDDEPAEVLEHDSEPAPDAA